MFAIDWLMRRRGDVRALAAWAGPQLLLILGAMPQLAIILAQRNSANIAWISPVDVLAGLVQAAIELLSGHEFPFGSFQAPALLLSLILIVILVPLRAPRAALPLAALALLGLVLLLGAGILLPRTALWLLLPLALLQAAALASVRTAWLRAGLIGLALGLGALDTAFCLWDYQPEPWQELLATLEAERQPGDVLVLLNGAPATALPILPGRCRGCRSIAGTRRRSMAQAPPSARSTTGVLPLAPIGEIGIHATAGATRPCGLADPAGCAHRFEPRRNGTGGTLSPITRRLRQRSVQLIRLAPP